MDESEDRLQRLALEDESEEDEEELPVMLGFTREASDPRTLERQNFPHKAGGSPAWLDPDNLPRIDDACCGFCNEPMQFLLQVYAPDDRSDTFHRILFVFMCVKMDCLKKNQLEQEKKKSSSSARSVKVFRSQLPRENKFYSSVAPDSPLTDGVRLCDWCRTWRGEKLCGGCRKVFYCSRKHQVEHWHADHSSTCKAPDNSLKSKKLWPEFEIHTCEEPGDYEAEDESGNPLQIVPAKQTKLSKELQEIEEASEDDKCWVAFQERMQRAPGQVLRYCREPGAKPLWTRLQGQPEPKRITPCHRCGGARSYEFQVLPQLLYYFGVENELNSLDWGTIVVFTCSESCQIEGYSEEFAWVQLSS